MIAVDATKELLVNVLEYHPFLVKPNNHELGEVFGVTLKRREEVIPYAERLRKMGAVNVLVSMAGEGAVLVAEDGSVYQAPAPKESSSMVWEQVTPWWRVFWQGGWNKRTTGTRFTWG